MAGLGAIRDAIKTTIGASIAGLRIYDTVPDVAYTPALVIEPAEADFAQAMGRGLDEWNLNLYLLCSKTVARVGQDQLDAYITGAGASSIRAVIFAAPTLGLADTQAFVSGMSGYGGSFESAGIDHVGAVLTLTVYTKGTA